MSIFNYADEVLHNQKSSFDSEIVEEYTALIEDEIRLFVALVLNEDLEWMDKEEARKGKLSRDPDNSLIFSWDGIPVVLFYPPVYDGFDLTIRCARLYEGEAVTEH